MQRHGGFLSVAWASLALGAGACDPPDRMPVAPDFQIQASPASVALHQGEALDEAITTTRLGGLSGEIALDLSGLPGGVAAQLSPPSVAPGSGATLTLTAAPGTDLTATPAVVTVTGICSGLSHGASFELSVVASTAPDFTLAASPAHLDLTRGTSASETVQSRALNGFSGQIALAATGLPTGVTGSFSPPAVAAGSSAALTLAASATTPLTAAPVPVTVSGSSGSATRAASFTVSVVAVPDFALTVVPAGGSVARGQSTAFTVNSMALGGFTGSIALTVTGLPADVAGAFSSASIAADSSATLTLTARQSAQLTPSPVKVTVNGASGALAHSATFTLSVTGR